jgi:putative tricarboxylic transport membrane protein
MDFMVDWSFFIHSCGVLFSGDIFASIILGLAVGVIFGAIPGLTGGMGIAIFTPLTFKLPLMPSLVFLTSIYTGGCFGGAISAILINTPGSPASVSTPLDGYPMACHGLANEALGISIAASGIGGFISMVFLLLAMKPLANLALRFGPPEMFMVAVFGLTIISSIQEGGFAKGMLAGLFGMMLGTMGMSSTGAIRGGFNIMYLLDGIPVIPALIGLFAFSELFFLMEKEYITETGEIVRRDLKRMLRGFRMTLCYPINIIRSSIIGIIIGAMPAAGAAVANIVSYNEAKRWSRHPETFGQGDPEGVVAAESANNASEGGALATMLALGIPGGQATAVLIGAFMLQGLLPGPRLFLKHMNVIYGLIGAGLVEEIFLLLVGIVIAYYFAGIIAVPTRVLIPTIVMFCAVGSFALRNTMFDAYLMFVFGLLGWIMRKHQYPVIAVVLGIILGPIADAELIRTYQLSAGDLTIFFTRPISLVLMILSVFAVAFPYLARRRKRR